MLLLFDIDGTLISAGGAGRRSLAAAFEEVFGWSNALDEVRLDGMTDPLILEEVARRARGTPLTATESEAVIATYLRILEAAIVSSPGYMLYGGALELCQAATESGRHWVGLATGNVEAGARIKLRRGGLDHYFGFGGFGSDARLRADLVRVGIARGRQVAEARLGRRLAREEIIVIGDTERDVVAAHEAGASSVGVLEGSNVVGALIAAQPDLLVHSLADPRLWRHLGL